MTNYLKNIELHIVRKKNELFDLATPKLGADDCYWKSGTRDRIKVGQNKHCYCNNKMCETNTMKKKKINIITMIVCK